ncbi:DNA-3-methyladenine glycosylase 1-like [Plodia interpunctella]|uniref:DNA-3-methyladenine glycosylase 1-like n=1 Tax=Plodia interpunctella TaxID=58824 RepID=UPI0023682968|nr:DNA-3-methyladenine glycosylase 1-like [Plodia interpunctella]
MIENNDKLTRCAWVTKDPLYIKYHDEEWGKPEYDSLRLFEMICLEGQQAGLSWITILKKRQNYKKLFCNFDPYQIIKLTENDINNLLLTSEIIRHKGKINSILNNAKCYIKMEVDNEDFSEFIWSFVNNKPIVNSWIHINDIPTESIQSNALSKALKKRGFKFVGATTCYAFMQACGLINDHLLNCINRK